MQDDKLLELFTESSLLRMELKTGRTGSTESSSNSFRFNTPSSPSRNYSLLSTSFINNLEESMWNSDLSMYTVRDVRIKKYGRLKVTTIEETDELRHTII